MSRTDHARKPRAEFKELADKITLLLKERGELAGEVLKLGKMVEDRDQELSALRETNTRLKRALALVEPLTRVAADYAKCCPRGKHGNILHHDGRPQAFGALCDAAEAYARDLAIVAASDKSPLRNLGDEP